MNESGQNPSLTICSVSFRHGEHLRLNRTLLTDLNPGVAIRWLVAENTPDPDPGSPRSDATFTVVPGAPRTFEGEGAASVQHGETLDALLPHVGTRFLLVLDPDFYVVMPHWIELVLSHMRRANLDFFGAPWHPRWVEKYRYFPCVHFLLVDLDRVERGSLVFRPPLLAPRTAQDINAPLSRLRAALAAAGNRPPGGFVDRAAAILKRNFIRLLPSRRRRLIGTAIDTGTVLHRIHARRPGCRHECLTPVFRPERDLGAKISPLINRWVESFLPDHLSYVPKRPGWTSRSGFRERGLPDAIPYGWEEFLWHDRAFAFHLRGSRTRKSVEQEIHNLRAFLGAFASRPGPGPIFSDLPLEGSPTC